MGFPQDDIGVSDTRHQAVIEVDEEGTEAAAATAITVGVTSAPAEPPVESAPTAPSCS